MSLLICIICVLAIWYWAMHRALERRARLTGCLHTNCVTREAHRNYGRALYLLCADCGWQHPVSRVVLLPDGAYWHIDEDTEEAHARFTEAYYRRPGQGS